MPWGSVIGPETVTESLGAGSGEYMTAGVELKPRETAHFFFNRVDVSPTEPWAISSSRVRLS